VASLLTGKGISRDGELRVGCCAVIFDRNRKKVMLTRRADNGLWCLPGGHMEAGESVVEACEREVAEETGLSVRVNRLIAVYSNQDLLVVYPDGRRAHIVVLSFETEVMGGHAGLSDETTDIGYFSLAEMESMPMYGRHKERVEHALLQRPDAIIA